jgi:predicted MFS family arabinose efflux permease
MKHLLKHILPSVADTDPQMRQVRHFLILMGIGSFASFQIWRSVFNNFAVEQAGVDAAQMGVIQGLREVPGFLALLVVFIIRFVSEQRLAWLSLAAMGLGIALTGIFPSYSGILLTTLLMSFGFHYYETVNQSLTLQHIPKDRSPIFLGQLRGWSGLAGLIGLGAVWLLSNWLSYAQLMMGAGFLLVAIAIWAALHWPAFEERVPQHKKMILKKRYWLYYALTFLSGARRQIFVAFAVFLLVKHKGFTVQEISGLFILNSAITLFVAPQIGRLVQQLGERFVITLEYTGLILVFFGYTVAESKGLLAFLYVIDHIFFNMSIAIRTYFQKIADPADVAPSMAVGFTINHIAAVVIPPLGGLIWTFDYRLTFYLGMALAFCSLLLGQAVKLPDAEAEELPAEARA